jgi:hypothetical protein
MSLPHWQTLLLVSRIMSASSGQKAESTFAFGNLLKRLGR